MQFNSIIFTVFLPSVLVLYHALSARFRAQNLLLLAASLLFYGWWDARFLALLVLSSSVDYLSALKLGRVEAPSARRFWVLLSLVTNLGLLGFFKYHGFFADGLARVLGALGMRADLPTLRILLPVGISFYTFQALSYTLDVYRRQLAPVRSYTDFLLFITFFPQLVAGPVERASALLPQILSARRVAPGQWADGIFLVLLGFAKKLVVADGIARVADLGFAGTPPAGAAQAWICLFAFACQIYGDFSGYSDIARGCAKLMGFELMTNFRAPYLVSNPAEFWRHWHISLSTWLRDYLYIPLGGNRSGEWLTHRNLLITMVLGGLWHGAGWAYLFWGLYHGVLLIAHRVWRGWFPAAAPASPWKRVPAVCGFFALTCIGWLLFRAGTRPDGGSPAFLAAYLRALLSPGGGALGAREVLFCGGLVLAAQSLQPRLDAFHAWTPATQAAGIGLLLALISLFGVFSGSGFIYFQF